MSEVDLIRPIVRVVGTDPWRAAAQTLLDENDLRVRGWRDSMTGTAYIGEGDFDAPRPRSAKSFAVFAHEVGHMVLHERRGRYRWREEIEAWDFAFECFDRFGLPHKRKTQRWAEPRVYRALVKARVRDRRALDREVRRDFPHWARRMA